VAVTLTDYGFSVCAQCFDCTCSSTCSLSSNLVFTQLAKGISM
jgi:hypothetical protein